MKIYISVVSMVTVLVAQAVGIPVEDKTSPSPSPSPCLAHQGHYQPAEDGTCGDGLKLDPEGCCRPCIFCPAGNEKEDAGQCLSPCVPCAEGYFSERPDNEICLRCTVCERRQRKTTRACQPKLNAKCGDCLPGYYEDPDLTVDADERLDHDCLHCPTDCSSQQPACRGYYVTSRNSTCRAQVENSRAEQDGGGSKGKGFPFWILAIIAAAVGGVAVFVVIMKHKTGQDRKPQKNESFPHERQPLGKNTVEYIELSDLGTSKHQNIPIITDPQLNGHSSTDPGYREDPEMEPDSETHTLVQ